MVSFSSPTRLNSYICILILRCSSNQERSYNRMSQIIETPGETRIFLGRLLENRKEQSVIEMIPL
jgi:hypothetical protein